MDLDLDKKLDTDTITCRVIFSPKMLKALKGTKLYKLVADYNRRNYMLINNGVEGKEFAKFFFKFGVGYASLSSNVNLNNFTDKWIVFEELKTNNTRIKQIISHEGSVYYDGNEFRISGKLKDLGFKSINEVEARYHTLRSKFDIIIIHDIINMYVDKR